MKTALVTGSLGQDGTYLTEHLLELGYKVFCGIRRDPRSAQTIEKATWAQKIMETGNVEFVYLDMRDELSIRTAIRKSWPDEIYNLAGQVYVPLSWEMPEETFDVNTGGLARILKVVEYLKKDTKVYQASSSEMFGNQEGACTVETQMRPTSPYGVSKFAAHKLVSLYRDKGIFAVGGILFNHESPRRGHEMVTRKIAKHVAAWATGSSHNLYMGHLNSRRDWGFAGEYVKAMHLMLQREVPMDYVVGTGESHSVADFLEAARIEMGLSKDFVDAHTCLDERFVRTQEIFDMRADNTELLQELFWVPQVKFTGLVSLMVRAEYEKLKGKEEVARA